jgi:hypothetical protein
MIPDHLEVLSDAMGKLQKNLGRGLIATSVYAISEMVELKNYCLERTLNTKTTNEFLQNLTDHVSSVLKLSQASELGDFIIISHHKNQTHYVVINNDYRWNTLIDTSIVPLGKILYYAIPDQILALREIQSRTH